MTVVNSNNQPLNSADLVGTGCKLVVRYNGNTYTYEIAVRGDVNGDGKVLIDDLSLVNQHIIKKSQLTGIKLIAGDVDCDESITLTDLSRVNQHIIKKSIL